MGLSLLGVFEIPVPGMVGSAAGQNKGEGFARRVSDGHFRHAVGNALHGSVYGDRLGLVGSSSRP